MPLPNLPTDIDSTDALSYDADDHENYHDLLHDAYNRPLAQSGTEKTGDYTVVASDANGVITVNGLATITLPTPSSLGCVDAWIHIFRKGSEAVTIAPGAGCTLESPPNTTGSRLIADQFGLVGCWARFDDTWVLGGNLATS